MKAWLVWNNWICASTVVFAETRGKARALGVHTDCCEGLYFTEVMVYRRPKLDDEYRGHWEMNWYDEKDRLALVKKAGWVCEYPERKECDVCVARDFCDEANGRSR